MLVGAFTGAEKERAMIHRFIEALRQNKGPSKFEKYFITIQRDGRFGHPSMSEARRDYGASLDFGGYRLG